jgi:hypothetical protein
MGPLDLLNHLLNFVAPACVVGVLMAVVSPFFAKNKHSAPSTFAQAAINSVAGGLALGLGLWFFGRDAKMASYGAMVLSCATAQWFALQIADKR